MNDPSLAPRSTLPGRWGALLYEARTTHVRAEPRRVFRHRFPLWLVDLDALPQLPRPLRPLARFLPRDHVLRPGSPTIRRDLERELAAHGLRLDGGRVLMLAQARSLGYVFNPLTVYWCRDAAGAPLCTVAEVHNTYGGRHRYLLHPDAAGLAGAAKAFHVSPFLPSEGRYRLLLPEPAPDGARLHLSVRLELPDGPALTATVSGTGRPAGPAALLRTTLRYPLATFAVSLRIRAQGVRLWLRGLPVRPCPPAARAPRP
ncbi:DUF1365 domain-containing protein [Kitasatospora phosalacinea]|uniref:DUF1365 domain-containing protein n=1 Tax=Kitasatospora phosalacinea TaxID=2065 RepID=UPI003AF0FAB7